jgi:hypothetical protein
LSSQKASKNLGKHLITYHLIRKTIYIIENNQNWKYHFYILENHIHNHTLIPPPSNPSLPLYAWIEILAKKAKEAKEIKLVKSLQKYSIR